MDFIRQEEEEEEEATEGARSFEKTRLTV